MPAQIFSPIEQYCDANGNPYAGGTLGFYATNTLLLKNTFTDVSAAIPNPNPIILDSAGRAPPVYGDGSYRVILKDSLGNLIWDAASSSYSAAISQVMLPVTTAATLQSARDALGVTAAINTAVSNVSLLQGATGPAGPQGPQGVQGPVGPAGASVSPTFISSSPGGFRDENTGFTTLWGIGTTGGFTPFVTPFPIACLSVVLTLFDMPVSCTLSLYGVSQSGFSCAAFGSSQGDNRPGVSVYYLAVGY